MFCNFQRLTGMLLLILAFISPTFLMVHHLSFLNFYHYLHSVRLYFIFIFLVVLSLCLYEWTVWKLSVKLSIKHFCLISRKKGFDSYEHGYAIVCWITMHLYCVSELYNILILICQICIDLISICFLVFNLNPYDL